MTTAVTQTLKMASILFIFNKMLSQAWIHNGLVGCIKGGGKLSSYISEQLSFQWIYGKPKLKASGESPARCLPLPHMHLSLPHTTLYH